MPVTAPLAQNPDELFDVVRADGVPTGIVKSRALVHRDGDWHRAVHVWVAGVGPDGGPWLMFQRRGAGKDTWPNRLDATVGGHFGAGETLAEALREVREEIGVEPAPGALRSLGVRVFANEAQSGVVDREVQEILLLRDDRPLAGFRPNPAEVAALVRFPLPALLDFLAGERPTVAGERIRPGEAAPSPVVAGPDDFVPTVDRYFYRVAIAAAAALRGERHVAV